MDDLDLDRTLRAAMAATPSPEFIARVRAKVAEAPAPAIVPGWLRPAAAIACAAIVAIVVGFPREDTRLKPSRTEITQLTAGLKPSTTYVVPSTTYVVPSTIYVAPSTRPIVVPTFSPSHRFGEVSPTEPPMPEVMVAADDVEALRRFLTAAHELRFVASFDDTPASTPWVMTDLSSGLIAGDALDSASTKNN